MTQICRDDQGSCPPNDLLTRRDEKPCLNVRVINVLISHLVCLLYFGHGGKSKSYDHF